MLIVIFIVLVEVVEKNVLEEKRDVVPKNVVRIKRNAAQRKKVVLKRNAVQKKENVVPNNLGGSTSPYHDVREVVDGVGASSRAKSQENARTREWKFHCYKCDKIKDIPKPKCDVIEESWFGGEKKKEIVCPSSDDLNLDNALFNNNLIVKLKNGTASDDEKQQLTNWKAWCEKKLIEDKLTCEGKGERVKVIDPYGDDDPHEPIIDHVAPA